MIKYTSDGKINYSSLRFFVFALQCYYALVTIFVKIVMWHHKSSIRGWFYVANDRATTLNF